MIHLKKGLCLSVFALVMSIALIGCVSDGDNTTDSMMSDSDRALALFKLVSATPGVATYEGFRSVNGVDSTFTTTNYKMGGKSRTDISSPLSQSRTYLEAGVPTTCSKQGENPWNCLNLPTAQKPVTFIDNPSQYSVSADGEFSAAGHTGSCYRIAKIDGSETNRACISKDGVQVYYERQDSIAIIKQTLVAWSNSVQESDFVLPA